MAKLVEGALHPKCGTGCSYGLSRESKLQKKSQSKNPLAQPVCLRLYGWSPKRPRKKSKLCSSNCVKLTTASSGALGNLQGFSENLPHDSKLLQQRAGTCQTFRGSGGLGFRV